jgi:hypothetical protein
VKATTLNSGFPPKEDIEIVEVSAGSTEYYYIPNHNITNNNRIVENIYVLAQICCGNINNDLKTNYIFEAL